MQSKNVKRFAEQLYETRYLPLVVKDLGTNSTTNSSQLDKQGRVYFGANFKGVFTPKSIVNVNNIIKNKEACCIFNTTEAGEHWVAFFRGDNGEIAYYDSFGRDPEELFANIRDNHTGAKHNITPTENDAEQNIKESNCGQRCLAYLLLCRDYGSQVSYFI